MIRKEYLAHIMHISIIIPLIIAYPCITNKYQLHGSLVKCYIIFASCNTSGNHQCTSVQRRCIIAVVINCFNCWQQQQDHRNLTTRGNHDNVCLPVNLPRFQGLQSFAGPLGSNKYLSGQQMISYMQGIICWPKIYCWPKEPAKD